MFYKLLTHYLSTKSSLSVFIILKTMKYINWNIQCVTNQYCDHDMHVSTVTNVRAAPWQHLKN